MTVGRLDLKDPLTDRADMPAVYGVGVPLQLSPTQAGIFCNLRGAGVPVVDFEAGTDIVIFNCKEDIRPANAQALSRNTPDIDCATGTSIIWVKYPIVGGFVPLGAKLPGGRAHPYAGTGFGLLVSIAFPADHSAHTRRSRMRRWSSKKTPGFRNLFDARGLAV